ncbi:MAG: hypothetical protein BMS9Abin23_0170 [Thermodesulfobacteriota bacterium]|nr:MAG: hypothetical protein BMS9Abin23_0170 [Thermodesulfobacteriota bacterium]
MDDLNPKPIAHSKPFHFVTTVLTFLDDVILTVVAVALIGVAVLLLYEALTDFLLYSSTHTVAHIIGELLFVLIIMELFRQVFRQITRKSFSLNPFIFIGFIAGIRGMLLMQMKLAMGEAEFQEGVYMIAVYAVVLLILVVSYYVYNKARTDSLGSQTSAPGEKPLDS